MDEMTLTLNNPLTEEEWDLIEDVDFDKTNSIEFHTKHGKTVKFVKSTDERAGDTISRRQAIDALDGEITVTGRANAEAVRGYARLVADRLKRLPSAQPEQQWIPATERLPENDGMYYATITRMGGIDAVPCIWYDKKWAIGGAKVIAWLAIPEPYRAERREE